MYLSPRFRAFAAGAALMAASALAQAQQALPNVMILATGGTIAGAGASAAQQRHLSGRQGAGRQADRRRAGTGGRGQRARRAGVPDRLGELHQRAPAARSAKRVAALAKHPDVDGIVITHGTDTLEETAYFLNLRVHTDKPIVMVGSMRPGTAMSADGMLNLYDAVAVAGEQGRRGKGVLVTHERRHPHRPRRQPRRINIKTNAFNSQWGPLGMVVEGKTYWFRAPVKRHTMQSEFDIDTHRSAAAGRDRLRLRQHDATPPIEALVQERRRRRSIHAGTGNGSVADRIVPSLQKLRDDGVHDHPLVARARRLRDPQRRAAGRQVRLGRRPRPATRRRRRSWRRWR